jgi:uncharacterized membrane protein YfcA
MKLIPNSTEGNFYADRIPIETGMNSEGENIFKKVNKSSVQTPGYGAFPEYQTYMEYLFILALLIVAFLYSSVGHGGASGYLAIMALFGTQPELMKSSALILNLFVAGLAFIAYYKAGYFRMKLLLPFVLGSIPMSFIGAKMNIDPHIYKILLGICLSFAVFRLFLKNVSGKESYNLTFVWAMLIGAFIGLFSGMIGIGGGIILSPLLIIFGWANLKETAAVSAMFILLNSVSGLAGLLSSGIQLNPEIFSWILAGIIGAGFGSYMGSFKLGFQKLQYILASVLVFAIVKLFVL